MTGHLHTPQLALAIGCGQEAACSGEAMLTFAVATLGLLSMKRCTHVYPAQ